MDTGIKPMTDAQAAFIKRLAHQVVGEGEEYLAKIAHKYGGGISTVQASTEIKHLQNLQSGARPIVQKNGRATTTAPPGRYAVKDTEGVPVIVEITKPTEGQWAGYTFVKTVPLIPNGQEMPVRGTEAVHVLNEIEKSPMLAAENYGRMTGRCGQCKRRLSDPQSLQIGIGPECRANFG